MDIEFFAPLGRAFDRMKRALFQPFDLRKWFVVGFAAFLAGLTDARSGGGFWGNPAGKHKGGDPGEIFRMPYEIWDWIVRHPGGMIAIAVLLLVIIAIGIALAWVSARAKFVFLDNVVRDHALIARPWREYVREGNSFFLWNLVLGVVVALISIPYLVFCFLSLKALYESTSSGAVLIVPGILYGLGMMVIFFLFGFVALMLKDFVLPIMYRDRTGTLPAARKFMTILGPNLLHFIGYALLLFFLILGIGAAVLLAGCVTCCIGFVILMIPYIGAVVLLPVSYTLRAFSVEFLQQFGNDFQVIPVLGDVPPERPPVLA
jgi:hypothetical protein